MLNCSYGVFIFRWTFLIGSTFKITFKGMPIAEIIEKLDSTLIELDPEGFNQSPDPLSALGSSAVSAAPDPLAVAKNAMLSIIRQAASTQGISVVEVVTKLDDTLIDLGSPTPIEVD